MLPLAQASEQLAPAMLLGNRPLGLGALIEMYESNYAGLWRLFGYALREPGWHVSHSPVNGELHLEVERIPPRACPAAVRKAAVSVQ